MAYFPITLNLFGKQCVVIGGGAVAERKIRTLLAYSAKVKVISPQLNQGLASLVKDGVIQYEAKEYRRGDLAKAFLVVGASDEPEVNYQIGEEAKAEGLLVNLADNPEMSSFFVLSVVRRGDLQIGISTEGKFPSLAKKIREELEAQFGPEYEDYLSLLGEIRERIRKRVVCPEERKKLLKQVLEQNLFSQLREGQNINPGKIVEALLNRK